MEDDVDEFQDDIEVVYLDDLEEIDDNVENKELDDQIVEDVVDLSKATFSKHSRSVFIGNLSKNESLAATGGEDDIAYVWSVETTEVILECTGHKDSVIEVAFNFDDQYVASGDMGGLIQVWSLAEKKLIWCFEGDDLEWLLWHHMTNVLIGGNQSGDCYIWQIPQGNCKVLPSYGHSCTAGKLLQDGKRILAGYNNGQIRLWDIKSTTPLWQLTDNVPYCGITSLDIDGDNSLFIAAPTAQMFKIVDGKQVACFLPAGEEDIEVIAFNNESGLIATGSLSGKLCIWDFKKNTLRHEAKLENSVTIIKWGPCDRLYAGVNDGCIYVCDAKSGTLIRLLTGHTSEILSLTLTKDGSILLSTSDDGTAKLFSVTNE